MTTESDGQPTTVTEALVVALARAERLGWRTITLRRLRAIAGGDFSQLPPDPATAPRSAFGQSAFGGDCYRRERATRRPA